MYLIISVSQCIYVKNLWKNHWKCLLKICDCVESLHINLYDIFTIISSFQASLSSNIVCKISKYTL